MEVIPDSTEVSKLGNIAELKQVTVATDAEIGGVNELLGQGWKLLHIGQRSDCTVYVLAKPAQQNRRRTGFIT